MLRVSSTVEVETNDVKEPSSANVRKYISEPLVLPKEIPREFNIQNLHEIEPQFDEAIHLQLEPPTEVRTMTFENVAYPYEPNTAPVDFAYTPNAFRVLSDEGIRVLRSVIESHKPDFLKQNERNNSLRGLGYLSEFVRDLTYSEPLVDLVSDLAQQPVYPHNCIMNHAHTNIGAVGNGKAVDQWHVDSVDFVCILVVSDTTNMKGGEIQVLQMGDATGNTFDSLKLHGIPDELVRSIQVPPAGYCLVLRGSKILHCVSPVLEGPEARHTVIQSWTTRNVFAKDLTRLDPLRYQFGDPRHVADLEYARHKAWRVSGQMKYLMEQVSFGTPSETIADVLRNAEEELRHARRLILGEISDIPGWLVNKDDKVTTDARDRQDFGDCESESSDSECGDEILVPTNVE